ncbi:Gag-Pol polyprotein [Vitis vinifera]|uniref:Gag-Pol polyprotein n=1 Tax=Vitis vinifera TaxID=29760 RepID=A0A438HIZ8_VITVI|nr:Gag-Pol polyprotein [Vitis vinifera]
MPSATLNHLRPMALCAWGMDIVGPPSSACPENSPCATDYFSKWVEAEAYASIKDKDVTKFVWKNIVCRFGIPQTIIADNGPQFDSIAFRNFCSELNIRNSYSTPRYPQSNGQAEATNKTLITALKKRLEQAKGKWVEELPGVLWAYRTTPGRPTGNTPFALAYGMDAVIPTEIGLPTIRTDAAKQNDANTELGRNLDWADEVRRSAAIRMADYQQRASAHYNRKVSPEASKMCKSSFCFFSIEASVRSCLTSPLSRAISSSASCRRASIDSSRLFAQPNRPEGLILPRAVDKLASPPPVSGAADLPIFVPRREGLHIISGPQQLKGLAEVQAASLTRSPPDEATEGDSCSGFGASTFTPDGSPRVQPHPGPSPGRLESQLPSLLRPPPDERRRRMSN